MESDSEKARLDALWAQARCERCPAMEERLGQCLMANRDLFAQNQLFAAEIEKDAARIKELELKLIALARATKWAKA